jgi:hypothetical protein
MFVSWIKLRDQAAMSNRNTRQNPAAKTGYFNDEIIRPGGRVKHSVETIVCCLLIAQHRSLVTRRSFGPLTGTKQTL